MLGYFCGREKKFGKTTEMKRLAEGREEATDAEGVKFCANPPNQGESSQIRPLGSLGRGKEEGRSKIRPIHIFSARSRKENKGEQGRTR